MTFKPVNSGIMKTAMESLSSVPQSSRQGPGITSGLSIDETLLLHTQQWGPAGFVYSMSEVAIPPGTFWTTPGSEVQHLGPASQAFMSAFHQASQRMLSQCSQLQGAGVVGVDVSYELHRNHVAVQLAGTAITRSLNDSHSGTAQPFISDLSARDFVLLEQAGWYPVGLSFGAGYVSVPRRGIGKALSQAGQNVELELLTNGMYAARERALDSLQRVASLLKASGVVGVNVKEGPLGFSSHTIGFTCWGTAVTMTSNEHRLLEPEMAIELDDDSMGVNAKSLRG